MFREGSLVTLTVAKSQHDGTETLNLSAGTAGMIVGIRREGARFRYIIDFGPYGQWNCYNDELSGEDDPDLILGSDGHTIQAERREDVSDDYASDEDNDKEPEAPTVLSFEEALARRVAEIESGH